MEKKGFTIYVIVVLLLFTSCINKEEKMDINLKKEEPKSILLKFQPVQCVRPPWLAWYFSGKYKFDTAPTDAQMAEKYYYIEHDVIISDFRLQQSAIRGCNTCNVCKASYYYTVKVPDEKREIFLEDGWEET
ncbi:MAG: hypothetical protein V1859_03240 [archaeon]